MIVLLEVIRGPASGRKIQLRGGQRATIGGTEHADISLSTDHEMRPIHFEVDCRGGQCILNTIPPATVSVNQFPASSHHLNSGDRIEAGRTLFAVTVEGLVAASDDSDGNAEVVQAKDNASDSLVDVCVYLELDQQTVSIAQQHQELELLIDKLLDKQLYLSAVRLRIQTMTKRQAVWWASVCLGWIESDLALRDVDREALRAARMWVQYPSESTRRAAETAAETTDAEGPAGPVAYAAFFSGGNIGHPDVDPVEPESRLCGRLLGGALLAAGYSGQDEADPVFRRWIAAGRDPIDGQCIAPDPLPEPEKESEVETSEATV